MLFNVVSAVIINPIITFLYKCKFFKIKELLFAKSPLIGLTISIYSVSNKSNCSIALFKGLKFLFYRFYNRNNSTIWN